MSEETKYCNQCGETKPLSDFYKRTSRRDGAGIVSECKACCRARSNRRYRQNPDEINDRRAAKTYGTTYEHIQQMRAEANGICQCCHRPGEGQFKRLVIDHDHATGKIRGLICHKCNTVLGAVNDDPQTLRNLARFLLEFDIQPA